MSSSNPQRTTLKDPSFAKQVAQDSKELHCAETSPRRGNCSPWAKFYCPRHGLYYIKN